ncbi:HWE histidine kinase domain-containing protein [Limoniibacter endophyticus]|uniref:Blue-light-activated histidine kinase n=1 Tax=Limoniibacter endophyticus TaxID=1565040 RepID=A0A8J3DPT9_9HYPH|nr:HWE histidine kinase domain-containing protein [Limoniibacter endophyticus]GHC74919.1 signal transduction histidine kinase [Limoniibacter endophyticus]
MTEPTSRVDLTNCDREPIHKLGAIQPFGFLIAVAANWYITRASVNIATYLGIEHHDAIGQPLSSVLHSEAIHTIRNRLTIVRTPNIVERIFGLRLQENGPLFDIAVHMSDGVVIIEAEPCQEEEQLSASSSVRAMMARLDQAATVEAFCREGARQMRAITGFDRVMIYRFDQDGAGEVVAEAAKPGIGSFMGLHYPASDIPSQARALYRRNLFRIIADVEATPVPVFPAGNEHDHPLDLSMSILRSVSPIHIEYLKNMGIGASLSISIIVDGELWGLFACHHYSPRLPSFERRSTGELFGQMFASRLESRERHLALAFETRARQIADQVLTSVADNATLLEDPAWLSEALSSVVPADGIGVWINGRHALSGMTPTAEQFECIVKALNKNNARRIFSTDHLGSAMPEIVLDGSVAGLIAIPISRFPRDYVVLFRQEIIRTVRWAGDPYKPVEYGANGPRLTPRKSFESWSELVSNRSVPFSSAEIRVAETIRVTLIEVVLRLTDEANRERQRSHERQELLIAELNHRVRNILSLISGLVRQSRSSGDTVSAYVEQLEGRIQSLARAHDQITRDSWSPAPLSMLLEAEAEAYLGKTSARLSLEGSNVLLQPEAYSTAALVFHELVTNSAKYGSLSDGGRVAVCWTLAGNGDLAITWRENGGPPVKEPTRQGFGTTIIRRSIPYDLGGRAEVTFAPEGLTAQFIIPARYVTYSEEIISSKHNESGRSAPTDRTPSVKNPLAGKRILLVEDNLIIAMDGEDILTLLGATEVVTASSVSQALELIEERSFDLALLDINLGNETSHRIAEKLLGGPTKFVFATGYGEMGNTFDDFPDAIVLQKPYTIESVAALLERISAVPD